MPDLVLTEKADIGEVDVLSVSCGPRRNTGLVEVALSVSKVDKDTSERISSPLEWLTEGLLLFPIPAGSSEVTKDILEAKAVSAEEGGTVPSWVVDVLSENGTTTREVGVNNAECVGIGLALSRVVGVVVMGKVINALEWAVCDVSAETWRSIGKPVEGMGLERTGGLAVLWSTSEGSTVLGNENVE